MGQPAVANALIGSAMKNACNDTNPSDGAQSAFDPEIVWLPALRKRVADDLIALGLPLLELASLYELSQGLPMPISAAI